tara:strand:+ start:259 stop:693 length:435 start_codon:yes stop_codon:yes gene_type:complete
MKIKQTIYFFIVFIKSKTMDSKLQIQNSIIVTICLIVLTVLSKVISDSPQNANTNSGVLLLGQALKWKKIASQDSQPFIKLQHLIFANTYIKAARQISKDSELENETGVDLMKLKKILDQHTQATIDNINSKCPKLKGKLYPLN